MAYIKINNVRIKGMAACAPTKVEENSEYPYFDENEYENIIPSIGVERRHVAKPGQTCSDFAQRAAEKLMEELGWERESIDLLIFCSPSKDYLQPDTACVLQGKLDLPESCMAFDMTLGCTGWCYGMATACSFVQTGGVKRALLLNGIHGSAESCYYDKTGYPLFSDVGTATALEFDPTAAPIYGVLGTIGKDYEAIIVPDGGRRNPVTEESLKLVEYEKNVKRNRLHTFMKGMDVFSFALKTAPKCTEAVLAFAGKTKDDIDNFFFHQANYYMVKKIIKKLKIDPEKAPISMRDFGNTGACSIPFTMVNHRAEQLRKGKYTNVGTSYGVGLSWASLCFETENLIIPELQLYD